MNLGALPLPSDALIRGLVRRVLSSGAPGNFDAYDRPVGDPGLFGPDSVTWRIHADFPGMMAGGLCALLLQTLHPRALAGVWDHSNFRDDLLGRLRRTTGFVAATTYAPRDYANAAIARVREIHHRVRGTLPGGEPYAADDPELLAWVHVTESASFLRGFQVYRGLVVPRPLQDRYYDEVRRVAEALGARELPRSVAEVDDYFRAAQPQLQYTERTHEVIRVLQTVRLPGPAGSALRGVFLGSGAVLLPEWAQVLLRRGRAQRWKDQAARAQLRALSPLIRRALRDGIAAHSCRRVGMAPERLQHWP